MFRNAANTSLLFVSIALFFLACENNLEKVNQVAGKQPIKPSEMAEVIDMIYTDSGKVQIRMKAPLMHHYINGVKEPYEDFPKGVYVEFFNDSSIVKTTLKSQYAIRYDQTQKMEVRYKVEVINEAGEKLETEKLLWDSERNKIKTDERVVITTKTEVISGYGLEANQDFSEWEISKVIGKKFIDEEEIKN